MRVPTQNLEVFKGFYRVNTVFLELREKAKEFLKHPQTWHISSGLARLASCSMLTACPKQYLDIGWSTWESINPLTPTQDCVNESLPIEIFLV
jgi:hypothetical protein